MRPDNDDDAVRIHFLDVRRLAAGRRGKFVQSLDADELERRGRFLSGEGRLLFDAAHGLARECLSLSLQTAADGDAPAVAPPDWRYVIDEYGKPHAVGPGGERPVCNWSHTRGGALVATARPDAVAALGVDLERADRAVDVAAMSRRFFAPEEAADVLSLAEPEAARRRFLAYWTLKESYLKALGRGLAKPLDSFAFAPPPPPPAAPTTAPATILYDRGDEGGLSAWNFRVFAPSGGFVAALSWRGRGGNEIRFRFP